MKLNRWMLFAWAVVVFILGFDAAAFLSSRHHSVYINGRRYDLPISVVCFAGCSFSGRGPPAAEVLTIPYSTATITARAMTEGTRR